MPIPIKVKLEPVGRKCTVELNGVDISQYVTRIEILAEAREFTRVTLDLINVTGTAEGRATVELVEQEIDTRTVSDGA